MSNFNNPNIHEILEEDVMERRSHTERIKTVTAEILCENSDQDKEMESDAIVKTINMSPAPVEIATITRTNTNETNTYQVSPSSDCPVNQTVTNTPLTSPGSTPRPSSPKKARLQDSKPEEKN